MVEAAPVANQVNVVRSGVLDSALRAFKRRAFNPYSRLDVVFVDGCGAGEGSIDDGGPRREFFRLLMEAMIHSKYFVGPEDSKSLALDAMGM